VGDGVPGAGEAGGYAVGDRVMAQLGSGGFAERVLVKARNPGLARLPPSMPFLQAAGFWMTYGTSYNAVVTRGGLRATETLLVLGAAGGVGLAAVEIGRALGARVIAAGSTRAKLRVCAAHGADELVCYGPEGDDGEDGGGGGGGGGGGPGGGGAAGGEGEGEGDDGGAAAAKRLKARLKVLCPAGVDVCFDPVGGPFSEVGIRAMARGGRHLVVGFAAGAIPRVALNLALLKECAIVGVNWGGRNRADKAAMAAELQTLLTWHAAGKLKVAVTSSYPLEQAPDALYELARRKATGKVILRTRLHAPEARL
jgi:NADPH2:quinone reductase